MSKNIDKSKSSNVGDLILGITIIAAVCFGIYKLSTWAYHSFFSSNRNDTPAQQQKSSGQEVASTRPNITIENTKISKNGEYYVYWFEFTNNEKDSVNIKPEIWLYTQTGRTIDHFKFDEFNISSQNLGTGKLAKSIKTKEAPLFTSEGKTYKYALVLSESKPKHEDAKKLEVEELSGQ